MSATGRTRRGELPALFLWITLPALPCRAASLAKAFGVARRRRTAKADASHCPAFTKAKLKMNLFNKRNLAAFTLIEMIVVMLIIATLAAALLTASSGVFDRARKTQMKND